MSTRVPKHVKHLQKVLTNASWSNFLEILHIVSRSNEIPLASEILSHLEKGDVLAAMDLADSLSSTAYNDATTHFVANQFASLIRKYPYPKHLNPFDPDAKARETFVTAEKKCAVTNERLKSRFQPEYIDRMRSFIAYVIGHEPNLDSIMSSCDFGPGACIGVHGNATHLGRKLNSRWSVTPSSFAIALRAVAANEQLAIMMMPRGPDGATTCYDSAALFESFRANADIVSHNKIAFVPKTARTSRSIAVEPLMNSFVQKGIDTYMRMLLKRVGIDLSDQERNCEFARIGSLADEDDNMVTIDLSSASDSISIELCRLVLPPSWFELLNQVRSKEYELDGAYHRYHKFCSMGNGFCFPLETLLFAAACHSVGAGRSGRDYLVYGDDIILRKRYSTELISLLGDIGFSVNAEKTFCNGPFRESCGRDWFMGEDVRPFILDFALDSLPSVFKFTNLVLRNRRTSVFFQEARRFLIDSIPSFARYVRPVKGPADTAIEVEQDEFMSSRFSKWDKHLQGWRWTELQTVPRIDSAFTASKVSGETLMIAALRGSTSSKPFTLRRLTSTRVRRVGHSCKHECVYGTL